MNERSEQVLKKLLNRIPQLIPCRENILSAYSIMTKCYEQSGKILVCGNGGSQADSDHIVGELMKGFLLKRPVGSEIRSSLEALYEDGNYLSSHLQGALPAISLGNHTALNSAYGNDVAADMIFAQQVFGYARENDVVLALSTSGNSKSVVNAVKIAKAMGVKTVGISGETGGQLKSYCDCLICVPETETFLIQELTLPTYHALCAMLELQFFE